MVKKLVTADLPVRTAKVAILGFTFKENCPDTRNTRIIDIVRELEEYGIRPVICDPQADAAVTEREYGLTLTPPERLQDLDAVVLAVAHREFCDLTMPEVDAMYRPDAQTKILLDCKGVLDRCAYEAAGYTYWRL